MSDFRTLPYKRFVEVAEKELRGCKGATGMFLLPLLILLEENRFCYDKDCETLNRIVESRTSTLFWKDRPVIQKKVHCIEGYLFYGTTWCAPYACGSAPTVTGGIDYNSGRLGFLKNHKCPDRFHAITTSLIKANYLHFCKIQCTQGDQWKSLSVKA